MLVKLSLAVFLLLSLSACARLTDCDYTYEPQSASLESLQCTAARGNRFAQYELGKRYAQGLGVEQDHQRAVKLYKLAAASQSGVMHIYSPPIGNEKYGRVMPINTGPATPGYAEAQFALANAYLKGEGVKPDRKKAIKWLHRAAAQGHQAALLILEKLVPRDETGKPQ